MYCWQPKASTGTSYLRIQIIRIPRKFETLWKSYSHLSQAHVASLIQNPFDLKEFYLALFLQFSSRYQQIKNRTSCAACISPLPPVQFMKKKFLARSKTKLTEGHTLCETDSGTGDREHHYIYLLLDLKKRNTKRNSFQFRNFEFSRQISIMLYRDGDEFYGTSNFAGIRIVHVRTHLCHILGLLLLRFGPWTHSVAEQDMALRASSASYEDLIPTPGWDVVNSRASREVVTYSCCPEGYARVTYSITFRRTCS